MLATGLAADFYWERRYERYCMHYPTLSRALLSTCCRAVAMMLTDMMNKVISQYLVTVLTYDYAQKLSRKKRVPIVSVRRAWGHTPLRCTQHQPVT